MVGLGGLGLGYAAGALSTLSPCVLPILPIVLFGVIEQNAWGPLALAAGLSISFAAVGVAIASVGFSIGLDPSMLRLAIAALIAGMGIVLLVPALQERLTTIATPVATRGQIVLDRLQPAGIGGQFVLGALFGVIWSPCSGPTLGAAVGLAAQGDSVAAAAAIMISFGLGAATPILALAYGSRQAIFARRDWLARVAHIGKPLMGVAFVGIGAFVLTGVDKIVEASLTRAMPDWLVTVTTRL
ncbi:cytochrome c biogenesis CcdA family protein [Bradyrhizobium zhanjiangense]|uniref:Cytochrome c biogenesis protein CcdA n=1 Tax=Bradyrhizobium zhanjiangense TaxID=1325107 RepID=A0ABY0DE49_9BRAD|nr:cytochrome c biogenesis CcdA family protein [Bradyrhizobium zhanjiangense]RXG90393.1 cytochrome c biogenesis protein CcdA [Bradyrhizobium zhanjiangense]